MIRATSALLLALCSLSFMAPAEAQWKWRDKSGRTQYSDLPPPHGVAEQDILSRPGAGRGPAQGVNPTTGTAAAAASSAAASASSVAASSPVAGKGTDPELEARRKKAEAEQAAKTKAEEARVAAAKEESCGRAKAHMRTLESGVRIVRANDKGEREILDDRQRADETRRTQGIIAAECR